MYYFLDQKVNEHTGLPQIVDFTEPQDLYDNHSVYAFGNLDFPEIPAIKYMILDKTAGLKDVMCAQMLMVTGLLINEKVKLILNRFNLPPHKYYPAFVKESNGNIHSYYWMQTSRERDQSKFLMLDKSNFYIKKDLLGLKKEPIEINSNEDLEKVRSTLELGQSIKLQTAVLKDEFREANLDLFKITQLSISWIMSEKMKVKLENENITGIEIRPADSVIIE